VRVVFMGTPEFAVPSLAALAEVSEVVGVFTKPDAVSGRGGRVRASAVSVEAERLELPVFRPGTLRDDSALEALAGLAPDLLIVAAYGLILPAEALSIAPLGAVNVHASLLPRWRGAAPIQWAILADDTETGVSIMLMEEGLDTGPYCLRVSTPVGDADAAELTARLARMGADALCTSLPTIVSGSAVWIPQDDSLATYAAKIAKTDVAIDPSMRAADALRRVRASLPTAPCRVAIDGREVTILTATLDRLHEADVESGFVACSKRRVTLGFADGALQVVTLRPQGKADMNAADWARGARISEHAVWSSVL